MIRTKQLPTLPDLSGVPAGVAAYLRHQAAALEDLRRATLTDLQTLEAPPVFRGELASNQSITANTLTAVAYAALVDTHSGWSGTTYTARVPGFYRVTWAAFLRNSAPLATSTYFYTQLNTQSLGGLVYGNGAVTEAHSLGSDIVESDGTTTIAVKALVFAATSPILLADDPIRTWLTINFIGRRAVAA